LRSSSRAPWMSLRNPHSRVLHEISVSTPYRLRCCLLTCDFTSCQTQADITYTVFEQCGASVFRLVTVSVREWVDTSKISRSGLIMLLSYYFSTITRQEQSIYRIVGWKIFIPSWQKSVYCVEVFCLRMETAGPSANLTEKGISCPCAYSGNGVIFIICTTWGSDWVALTLNIPRGGVLWGPQRVIFCDPAVTLVLIFVCVAHQLKINIMQLDL